MRKKINAPSESVRLHKIGQEKPVVPTWRKVFLLWRSQTFVEATVGGTVAQQHVKTQVNVCRVSMLLVPSSSTKLWIRCYSWWLWKTHIFSQEVEFPTCSLWIIDHRGDAVLAENFFFLVITSYSFYCFKYPGLKS